MAANGPAILAAQASEAERSSSGTQRAQDDNEAS
jgi:hypothetical protein